MVNVIRFDHVDDVRVIKPNQHDDIPVVPEPVLVHKDEDPKEEKTQEEEDDMDVDIKEDENEPDLTYPYEEVDPLNPLPPASESEPKDVTEVENTIEHEDETVLASIYEKGKAKDEYYGKLILNFGNEEHFSVEQGTTVMEELVEKLGNTEEKVECKKLKELKEAMFSNTFLFCTFDSSCYPSNDQGKCDAAIAAERARHANARGSGPVRGQDAAPAVCECTFVRISECAEGKKVKFVATTLQGPTLTWWNANFATMGLETVNQMPWTEMKQLTTVKLCPIEEVQRMEHELWNLKVKEYNIVAYTQRFNKLSLMCPRMVELKRVKVYAYIQGLTDNIKG
nr:hypothetical protein [Tanacetum cinerariifolium]